MGTFFDGRNLFGEHIHSIGTNESRIVVYAVKGHFISDDLGKTWSKNYYQNRDKLYLDDVRPVPQGFTGVRNYSEFVLYIKQNGLPQLISFDHDLGEGKSGFCLDRNLTEINFQVHSQNPVGKENIESLLGNFSKRSN